MVYKQKRRGEGYHAGSPAVQKLEEEPNSFIWVNVANLPVKLDVKCAWGKFSPHTPLK